jgi:uncharacterized damage-inducible protein DinB
MNAQDAIRGTLEMSTFVLKAYVGDLTDAELLNRPGKGCNHLAWQLGHLISSEAHLLNAIKPGAAADLPEGFVEQHSKAAAGEDDPARFCSLKTYLDLLDKSNAATLAALATFSEEDLDGPSPEDYRKVFPTVGSIFLLIATHPMMHAGQVVPVRRALGKPVVM